MMSKAIAGVILAALAVDVATTLVALRKGWQELNPILTWAFGVVGRIVAFVAAKTGKTVPALLAPAIVLLLSHGAFAVWVLLQSAQWGSAAYFVAVILWAVCAQNIYRLTKAHWNENLR